MSAWTAEQLVEATGGSWLVAPSGRTWRASGVATDTRSELRGCLFAAIRGERFDGHDFLNDAAAGGAAGVLIKDAAAAIPAGVPALLVPSVRRALADLARAHRRRLATTTVIAITGSSGKTTTKSLIDHLLREDLRGVCAPKSFNNDIGVPLTILDASPDDDYLIVEVGTNAPGEIAALAQIIRPHIAIITSIGRAHLERLGSIDGVLEEKGALLESVETGGLAIIPAAWPALRSRLRGRGADAITFGGEPDAMLRLTSRTAGRFEVNGCDVYDSPLPGAHNAQNAIIAVAVARLLGARDESIRRRLRTAALPDMRLTPRVINGVTFFNDAYNANPDSMRASIEAFAETSAALASRRIVILGDMLELGPAAASLHEEVGRTLAAVSRRTPIALAILIGTHAADFARGVAGAIDCRTFASIEDDRAAILAALGDTLAPGSAVLLKGSRRIALERIIDAFSPGNSAGNSPAHSSAPGSIPTAATSTA